mmetsp:Transcript_20980/g.25785  ORF Transcript_20980/g.25785 Transcript_20980/m.25785 type:complete len:458 (-) Transcript_20980:315-1688(-)
MGRHLELGVHDLGLAAGGLGLGAANIGLSEEELTVQVGNLNVIIVGNGDGASGTATETHESHSLGILATESTSTDHEGLDSTELLLSLATVDLDLVVVAAVHGLSVNGVGGQRLEAVVVGPLLEGHVLASILDDLLGDESTEHGRHGGDRAGGVGGDVLADRLVDLLNAHGAFSLVSIVHSLGNIDDLGEVSLGVLGVATLLVAEGVRGSDGKVKILRSSHAEIVHVERLEHAELSAAGGVLAGSDEILEGDLLGHLHVLDDTLAGVSTEVGSVELQLEAVGARVKDFNRAGLIDFAHTLDLDKFDEVAILIRVALVLMDVHGRVLTLLDAAHDELASRLAVSVGDEELGAVVQEGVGGETHSLGEDEADLVVACDRVQLSEALSAPEVLSDANHVVIGGVLVSELADGADPNVRVQRLELGDGGLGSRRVANVLLADIKVGTLVANGDLRGVVERH